MFTKDIYISNLQIVFISLLLTVLNISDGNKKNVWVSDLLYHSCNGNLLPDCLGWYWETQT